MLRALRRTALPGYLAMGAKSEASHSDARTATVPIAKYTHTKTFLNGKRSRDLSGAD
jgi:hypothetical protein